VSESIALSFKKRALARGIGFPGNFVWVLDTDYILEMIIIIL